MSQGDCSRGPQQDSENFIGFLKDLSETLTSRGLLLSIAVSANKIVIDRGYTHIPLLARYVDWIGVLAYDYYSGWGSETGHIAPLYYHPDNDVSPFLNANFSVTYWINKGVPAEIIVLGIPTYGSSFTLSEKLQNELPGFRAKVTGPGKPGKFTRSAGFLAYYEVRISYAINRTTIIEYC